MGDCGGNSNNSYHSGSSTCVKGTIRQSPDQISTTVSEKNTTKALVSSAGFTPIIESSECRFEYSTQKKYLRKKFRKRSGASDSERTEIYRLVSTDDEKAIIENAGGKWTEHRKKRSFMVNVNVKVYEHVNNQDYITGWYKTVTRVKKPDGSFAKRVRYYRRVGVN